MRTFKKDKHRLSQCMCGGVHARMRPSHKHRRQPRLVPRGSCAASSVVTLCGQVEFIQSALIESEGDISQCDAPLETIRVKAHSRAYRTASARTELKTSVRAAACVSRVLCTCRQACAPRALSQVPMCLCKFSAGTQAFRRKSGDGGGNVSNARGALRGSKRQAPNR